VRLELTLFVKAENQRLTRRRQGKADDIADFVDEQWIAGSIKLCKRCGCKPKALQMRRVVACE
jgi:hypothetical protein